jgi:hypothetical protein
MLEAGINSADAFGNLRNLAALREKCLKLSIYI